MFHQEHSLLEMILTHSSILPRRIVPSFQNGLHHQHSFSLCRMIVSSEDSISDIKWVLMIFRKLVVISNMAYAHRSVANDMQRKPSGLASKKLRRSDLRNSFLHASLIILPLQRWSRKMVVSSPNMWNMVVSASETIWYVYLLKPLYEWKYFLVYYRYYHKNQKSTVKDYKVDTCPKKTIKMRASWVLQYIQYSICIIVYAWHGIHTRYYPVWIALRR